MHFFLKQMIQQNSPLRGVYKLGPKDSFLAIPVPVPGFPHCWGRKKSPSKVGKVTSDTTFGHWIFWIWFIYTLEGAPLLLWHFFKVQIWNTLICMCEGVCVGVFVLNKIFSIEDDANIICQLRYAIRVWSDVAGLSGPDIFPSLTIGQFGILERLSRDIYVFTHDSRGWRYPTWLSSMFEFCQKMIQFNVWFNITNPKFNSNYLLIQNKLWRFNSKDNSIQ